MNIFDKCRILIEAEIATNVENYLKRFDKKIIDDFETKLRQAYKLGTKFDGTDSYETIKSHFILFDPTNKKTYKDHTVTNIKTSKEAHTKETAKEMVPPVPVAPIRADFSIKDEFDEANIKYAEDKKAWERTKAIILGKKLGKEKEKQDPNEDTEIYDDWGYAKELKTNKKARDSISVYLDEVGKINLFAAFTAKDTTTIKNNSDQLIKLAENILAVYKIFDFNDFKKDTKVKGSVLKDLLTAYNAAKGDPLSFKKQTDLKRSLLKLSKHHNDIAVGIAARINNEIYGHKTGRTDVDRKLIIPLVDSAVGEYIAATKLCLESPTDIVKFRSIVSVMFSDMGLWKKGGANGGHIISPEDRFILGGATKPEDNQEETANTTTLYPKTEKEKTEFEDSLIVLKKIYNWYIGRFKISDKEIMEEVLKIKINGIYTLMILKHSAEIANASSHKAKAQVLNAIETEIENLKTTLNKPRTGKVLIKRPNPDIQKDIENYSSKKDSGIPMTREQVLKAKFNAGRSEA